MCISLFAEIVPRCGEIKSDRLPRAKLLRLCQHAAFSLVRSTFSGPVVFASTSVPLWHDHVIHIAPIHLTLLFYSSVTICRSVMLDSCLPRAKLCCFSAKSDRCDSRARRSDGSRCCNRASMNFNEIARCAFLRLPRSYCVAEKSDPIGS